MSPEPSAPPLVSIGLPVYNAERFLPHVLDVIASQTFTAYELVISDNASTDGTAAICSKYMARDRRIRYFRNERTVPAVENFWRTFERSSAEFFFWQAADDRRPPDAIVRALEAFERHPRAVMVHGPVDVQIVGEGRDAVVSNRMELTDERPGERVAALLEGLQHNAMFYGVYRREALRHARVGRHVGWDFLLCLQMASAGPIAYASGPLIAYRHVNGPVDDPMYRLTPTSVRALLFYRGTLRSKCSKVLCRGVWYLLRYSGAPVAGRLEAATRYVGAFTRRYWRHLLRELAFLVATPAEWAVRPLASAGRRLRQVPVR